MWASSSGPGAGERPLARHLQAYFQACFQLTDKEPEQNPSWYLPATALRQHRAGIRHRNLPLPPRAATTNQEGTEFWAPAKIPVLARLQFPSLISWLKSLGQTMEAGTSGLLPAGRLRSGCVCHEMVSVVSPLAFQPQSPALQSPGEERTRVIAQLNVASVRRFFQEGSSSQ